MYLQITPIKKNISLFLLFFCISGGIECKENKPSKQSMSKKKFLRKSLLPQYFDKKKTPVNKVKKITKKKLRKSQGQIFNRKEIISEILEKKEEKNPKDVVIFYKIATNQTYVSKSDFYRYKKLHTDQFFVQRQTYSNQGKQIICTWEIDQYADLYKELLY